MLAVTIAPCWLLAEEVAKEAVADRETKAPKKAVEKEASAVEPAVVLARGGTIYMQCLLHAIPLCLALNGL